MYLTPNYVENIRHDLRFQTKRNGNALPSILFMIL